MTDLLPIQRLEQYTERFTEEVLMVEAVVANEEDVVLIFRGFASSLMRPTAFDPEVPVIPKEGVIETIARIRGPYMPDNIQYLERDIAWTTFRDRLAEMGL